MAKVIVHQGFVDKDTGTRYFKGDNQDMPDALAKRAANHGWVGIYPKKKTKATPKSKK